MHPLHIIQIFISVGLITLIMLQSQDSNIQNPFGAVNIGYHTKTSTEKALYVLTVILAISFVIVSVSIMGL